MSKIIHDNFAQIGATKDFTEIKLKIKYSINEMGLKDIVLLAVV